MNESNGVAVVDFPPDFDQSDIMEEAKQEAGITPPIEVLPFGQLLKANPKTVSYTHLTLPTIYTV